MIYINELNGKAVISTDESGQMLPSGVYICAVYYLGEVCFFGAITENDLIPIGKTLDPTIETVEEAKSIIDSLGCRFLNGNPVN